MSKNYYAITLALAGVCQAAKLVQQLAFQGKCDDESLHVSLGSILQTDSDSVLTIFGSQQSNLKLGLETLISLLGPHQQKNHADLLRYALNLIVLQNKLQSDKSAMDALGKRIEGVKRQLLHFDLMSETVLAAMADIYINIIGSLGSRIQITGSAQMLKQAQVQNKVRAALLAGVRAAVLWQQVGGGRLQLIFSRNRLKEQAQSTLLHC